MTKKYEFEKTLNNLNINVRYPIKTDAQIMCDYINTLSKEKTYIAMQGEVVKLQDEKKYLNNQLKRIKTKESVQLLLFVNNELAGITSIDLKNRVHSHIGTLGISILKKYRGIGLGKILMEQIIDQAIRNLKKLKIITLEVFAKNSNAISMYKSFEFKEYGMLPRGNMYKGKFLDDILMYKTI